MIPSNFNYYLDSIASVGEANEILIYNLSTHQLSYNGFSTSRL